MMKKTVTSPYRKLKVLLVLPVFAIVFYAFATPEYKSIPALQKEQNIEAKKNVQQDTSKISVKIEKGLTGNPLVVIDGVPGTREKLTQIDPNTIESINVLKSKSAIDLYGAKGNDGVIIITTKRKPVPTEQSKKMNETEIINSPVTQQEKPQKAIFIDGVFTDKSFAQIKKDLGHKWGVMKPFSPGEGLKKYGEQGKNGGYDIFTREKATEMGLKLPYPRIDPEDYPTFRGQGRASFNEWLTGQIKYPEDAITRGISGKVTASYTVNPDGTLSNPEIMFSPDKSLEDAVVKAIAASPQWEPPKNPESTDPFKASVSIKFELPDKIYIPEEPFVVVEEMPMFLGGGDAALLEYIRENIRYPEYAKTNRISGRVIIRFVVSKEGKAQESTVLKGVDPSLDAEALRVVNSLPAFKPGKQGGKPVPVYYMVPVTFSLTSPDSVKTNP